MKRRPLSLVALVAVACASAALGACPPAPSSGLRYEDMDRLAAAYANAILACEERPAFEALVEPTDPRDRGRIERGYRAYFRLLFDDTNIAKDEAAFARCLAFLESDARCDGFGDDDVEGDCDRIFSGTLARGEPCAAHEQCVSDLCFFGGASTCGVCGDRDVAKEGEACGVRECDEGLFCQYGRPDGAVCARVRAPGEPCFEDVEGTRVFFRCALGAYCASDDVCRPEGAVGDACDAVTRCGSGLDCSEGRCRERLVGEREGDPCDPDQGGCGRTLQTGLSCEGPAGAAVCVRAVVVDEGEACDGGNDEDERTASRWCKHALSTHRCQKEPGASEGVCVRRAPVGASCGAEVTCDRAQGGCVSEGESATCRAWPALGEPCLVVDGAFSCGPQGACVRELDGVYCAEHSFPTVWPFCG